MNPIKFFLSLINAIAFSHLYIKGKILPGFKPSKDDLVIDLGSGDKPFWRADVCLDNLSLGDEQRFSFTKVVQNFGLFVNSDISKTPFENQTFDFSFCSHVLEHVEDPEIAIKEIMRISKKGYIEIPNGLSELLFPYQSHLWLVFLEKSKLVFIRKNKSLHEALANQSSKYLYLTKILRTPVIYYYWKSKINYKVINDIKEDMEFKTVKDDRMVQPWYIQNVTIIFGKLLRLFLYKEKQDKINILRTHLNKK